MYRATEKNFQGYRTYPIGTILFTCTFHSNLSWIVMYSTNSTISHVACFYGDGIVNDCTTSGIIRHSFADYLDGESYVGVIIPPPEKINAEKVRAFMDETLGDGYNWAGVVSTFFHILFGAHREAAWRLWADFVLTNLVLLACARWLTPASDYVFGTILLVFVVTVAVNRLRLKKCK
jgi:hypothetical protein